MLVKELYGYADTRCSVHDVRVQNAESHVLIAECDLSYVYNYYLRQRVDKKAQP